MRVAGFILCQLAALLFSAQRISAGKRRAAALASFCAMLEQLGGALESEASPMPELLDALRYNAEGAAARFLGALSDSMESLGTYSFQELWKSALYEGALPLDRESAQALEELGAVLGRFELGAQLKALALCRASLCRRLEALRRGLPQTRRLTLGLSLAASALLGIILI